MTGTKVLGACVTHRQKWLRLGFERRACSVCLCLSHGEILTRRLRLLPRDTDDLAGLCSEVVGSHCKHEGSNRRGDRGDRHHNIQGVRCHPPTAEHEPAD